MKRYFNILFFFSFVLVYSASNAEFDKEKFAIWNLNYASFLVDEGRYLEAIEAYDSAIDSSVKDKTIYNSLLQKAVVFSIYLNLPDEALLIYDRIYNEFSQMAETALYQKALLLFESSYYKQSIKIMQKYQQQFPNGKFIFHVEVLLNQAENYSNKKTKSKRLDTEPILRILISKNGKHKQIKNVKLIAPTMKINHRDTPILTGNTFEFYNKNNRITICHNKKTIHLDSIEELFIESNHPIIFITKKKHRMYRGKICLKPIKGKLQVINYVLIEQYLRSVVPCESISSWPKETLKAQIIAARTYAYKKLLSRREWDFDLYDDTWDQVYGGVEKETNKINKIIQETRGIIIITKKMKPIQAFYTSNNGGFCADVNAIFGLKNLFYLKAKPDYDSSKANLANWTRIRSTKEIEELLSRRHLAIGSIKRIYPTQKGPSGRVLKIKIVGESKEIEIKSKPFLTGGGLKLPEILFNVTKKNDKYIFQGHGFGHGVGYSQWGGYIMGRKGKNWKEILSFYYTNTNFATFW